MSDGGKILKFNLPLQEKLKKLLNSDKIVAFYICKESGQIRYSLTEMDIKDLNHIRTFINLCVDNTYYENFEMDDL